MRNPERLDKFYEEVKEIHKTQCPDWRVGQFWVNVLGQMASEGRDPFFPEEEEMLNYIKKFFNMK